MQRGTDIGFDQVEPARIRREIDLGQHDESGWDLQQVEYGQVLAGLRHHAFVRGDDQQRGVDPPDARQHILDEVAVTRHIHDACFLAIWKGEPAKAQLDGHLACLLFLEPVRVHPGQRGDERGLAVIYVTCCSDDAHIY